MFDFYHSYLLIFKFVSTLKSCLRLFPYFSRHEYDYIIYWLAYVVFHTNVIALIHIFCNMYCVMCWTFYFCFSKYCILVKNIHSAYLVGYHCIYLFYSLMLCISYIYPTKILITLTLILSFLLILYCAWIILSCVLMLHISIYCTFYMQNSEIWKIHILITSENKEDTWVKHYTVKYQG